MKRQWTLEDLVEHWTLVPSELAMLEHKRDHSRLGMAALLKFYQLEGRFPYHKHEVPSPAVAYLAKQVGVPTEQYVQYPWSGRTVEYHRAQIRTLLGWREATEQDAVDLGEWLCAQVLPQERDLDHLKVVVAARCRVLQIEPPSAGQIDRLVRSALRTHEELFCATLLQRLTPSLCARLDALLQAPSAPSPETASAQPLSDAPPREEATGSGHPEPGRPPWSRHAGQCDR